ncbi:MAG: hypothetical protein OEV89_02035 [Desulfobulbaceae bacterium]|nr:hypothetical protein [Desulfobulbaceae bacterium]HIJ89622.1 hypothetical protein [Deltaproteobacteria bacterium]
MMNSREGKTAHGHHYAYHGTELANETGEGINMAAFGILVSLAGIVGFWGMACLVAGLMNNSLVGLGLGWLAAILGV